MTPDNREREILEDESVVKCMKLDLTHINDITIKGKGGKEKLIMTLFPGAIRKSNRLYDFVQDNDRSELKTQRDAQWFDLGKYSSLSDEERNIIVIFVIHQSEKITQIVSIPLGILIDTLTSDSRYASYGWTKDCIKQMGKLKENYPRLQTKAELRVKQFISAYPQLITVHYKVQ